MNNRIHKHAPNCTYLWCIVALVPFDIQSHFRDLLNLTVADSTISIGSLHIPKELIDFLFFVTKFIAARFQSSVSSYRYRSDEARQLVSVDESEAIHSIRRAVINQRVAQIVDQAGECGWFSGVKTAIGTRPALVTNARS